MRTRWRLSKDNDAAIACVLRPLLDGVDVRITYNGLLVAGRVCQDEPDALLWAEDRRREWMARGWTEVLATAQQVDAA